MIDPATFRRFRPNYRYSIPDPDDLDLVSDNESKKSLSDIEGRESSSSDSASQEDPLKEKSTAKIRKEQKKEQRKWKKKAYRDDEEEDEIYFVSVRIDDKHKEQHLEDLPTEEQEEKQEKKPSKSAFTDEEYLIASPVVLGFSFEGKLWLEFPVSCIHDIQWNDGAFDSLVIPDEQKYVVRALVENHANKKDKNIDDVIQGKGRGLVAVLHGPPGTGKRLTAEGIADLLRKPLYVRLLHGRISNLSDSMTDGIGWRVGHQGRRPRTQPQANSRLSTHLGRAFTFG